MRHLQDVDKNGRLNLGDFYDGDRDGAYAFANDNRFLHDVSR